MTKENGSIKSNSFKVPNLESFDKFLNKYEFGNARPQIHFERYDDDGVWIMIGDPDAKTPDIIPIKKETGEGDSLDEFMSGLRELLYGDHAFCLVAQLNVDLYTQICSRLIVSHEGYRIDTFEADRNHNYLKSLVKERNDER